MRPLLAGLLLLAAAGPPDRRVRLVNASEHAIVGFSAHQSTGGATGGNILDGRIVRPGTSVLLTFDGAAQDCKFDFLTQLDNGIRLRKLNFNVCEETAYTVTDKEEDK